MPRPNENCPACGAKALGRYFESRDWGGGCGYKCDLSIITGTHWHFECDCGKRWARAWIPDDAIPAAESKP